MTAHTQQNLTRQELGKIALVSMRAARLIMESGGRARIIAESAEKVAIGLGAEFLGLRIGYASLAISLGNGEDTVTRMIPVGRHGVNHRLDQKVRNLVRRTETESLSHTEVDAELERIVAQTPRHSPPVVALAVGFACAAFGRLLGVDWMAVGPIFLASGIGQLLRHEMLSRRVNPFVVTAIVAFTCGIISGFGARLAGSTTVSLGMMASILLLVPGIPATNAQTDIMDGHPTTGSARAVSVLMIMIFATAGIWLAGLVLGVRS